MKKSASSLAVTMRFFTPVLAIALAGSTALAGPTLKSIQKFSGQTTGGYIVQMKSGASKDALVESLEGQVTHDWDNLNGFSGM